MTYRITAPVEGYTGTVAGVAFTDGKATTDNEAAVAYFRRHGYEVEEPRRRRGKTPDPGKPDGEQGASDEQGADGGNETGKDS